MAISSAGLGSGLDVNSIVAGLMNVEKKPLNNVAAQKASFQTKISAYSSLKSALSTFQTSVTTLSSVAKFNAQAVTSGNTSMFTATSNGSATVGDYAVNVTQLAKSQKLASAGFANVTDAVGTGTLTISFGQYVPASIAPPVAESFTANAAKNDVTVTINSSNNSLAGLRDAINAANASVSASIVNNGTSNQLVITSKDTGEVNSLKISVADDDANNTDASGLSRFVYDPLAAGVKNLTQVQQAKDALLEVDGISVVKSSNTITDVIEGVTLNLLATSGGNSVNLGIASDKDAIKKSVTEFVDAFNKLDTTLRGLTKYDETGKSSGALLGDSTARSVIGQIRAVLNSTINNGNSINALNQIGVSFGRTGQLSLDATKLTSAITNNFSEIADLFAASAKATDPQISYVSSTNKTQAGTYAVQITQLAGVSTNVAGSINGVAASGSSTKLRGAFGDASEGLTLNVAGGALGARGTVTFALGYAAQLDSVITNLLSEEGVLASRTDGINNSIKRLDKQTEAINVRLAAIEARYRAQFTRLDTLLSSMSTTSAFLTQQIATINANSK